MDSRVFYSQKNKYKVRVPPEYESEDSELSDSDDDPVYTPPQKNSDSSDDDMPETSADSCEPDLANENDDAQDPTDASAVIAEQRASSAASTSSSCSSSANLSRQPIWKNVNPEDVSTQIKVPTWKGTLPPSTNINRPLGYFMLFFQEVLMNLIVEQSNLFAVQSNLNKPLCLTRHELEQFIGCCMLMSIFKLPRSRMYWAAFTRIQQIADIMTRDRWEAIKRNLHFNNNENMPSMEDANRDRLFKIRPLHDHLLPIYQQLPQQQVLCIDEQMVPFKGRSVLKQYLPMKPHKWGYKLFVLCDTQGIVHNFEIFTGKISPVDGFPDLGATSNIVIQLSKVVEADLNHVLWFDNWYTSMNLLVELSKRKIFAIGTVRSNRLLGCTLQSDSKLKTKGRGSFDEKCTNIAGVDLRVVKWYDNRAVILTSTCSGAQSLLTVDSYDRRKKQTVSIQCPSIVKKYNQCMGGVDLLDALISYYRIHLKSKKYYHRCFFIW